MKDQKPYTTKLQAGLGMIEETRVLLDLWQPGTKALSVLKNARDSGCFPGMSARRLRNLITECFAPRFLSSGDYPALVLKELHKSISYNEFSQLLFLHTARVNPILEDFITEVYWNRYESGSDVIMNENAQDFVKEKNREGKTTRSWSEITIRRVASYLTGCCADFGLLETGRKTKRKISSYRAAEITIAYLAYDLHFSGLGDNAMISHRDWKLFGMKQDDVREELKRLALKSHFIIQSAGEITRISWNYKSWEDFVYANAER